MPVQTFFEYLEADHSLQEFLEDFLIILHNRTIAILESLKVQLLNLNNN
jgi:hypothetical protein